MPQLESSEPWDYEAFRKKAIHPGKEAPLTLTQSIDQFSSLLSELENNKIKAPAISYLTYLLNLEEGFFGDPRNLEFYTYAREKLENPALSFHADSPKPIVLSMEHKLSRTPQVIEPLNAVSSLLSCAQNRVTKLEETQKTAKVLSVSLTDFESKPQDLTLKNLDELNAFNNKLTLLRNHAKAVKAKTDLTQETFDDAELELSSKPPRLSFVSSVLDRLGVSIFGRGRKEREEYEKINQEMQVSRQKLADQKPKIQAAMTQLSESCDKILEKLQHHQLLLNAEITKREKVPSASAKTQVNPEQLRSVLMSIVIRLGAGDLGNITGGEKFVVDLTELKFYLDGDKEDHLQKVLGVEKIPVTASNTFAGVYQSLKKIGHRLHEDAVISQLSGHIYGLFKFKVESPALTTSSDMIDEYKNQCLVFESLGVEPISPTISPRR